MAELELTVKQAAKDLRTTPRTIRRWIKAGKLEGRKVGRVEGVTGSRAHWLITEASVRKIAADITRGPNTRTPAAAPHADSLTADLLAEVRSLRQENAEYLQHLERLTVAVEELTKALPPAPPETWWHRMWQRIGGGMK